MARVDGEMTMFSTDLMKATAVEMQAVQASEARAEEAEEARVEVELEAQELRAKLAARQVEIDALTARNASLEAENGELAKMLRTQTAIGNASRDALRDALAYIRRQNGAMVELLEHLMPTIDTADWRQRTLIANAYEALEMPERAVAAFPTGTIRRTA